MSTSPHPSGAEGDDALRSAIPLEHEQTPLWEELSQHLDTHGKLDLVGLREELERSPWRTTPAGEAVHRCLERDDATELLTLAHRLGREWLAAG
jgi:hypothetical protein